MKKVVISVLFIVLLTSAFACLAMLNRDSNDNNYPREAYNMNPDTSKKVVGSKILNQVMDIPIFKKLDEYLNYTDLIIIGKVITPGTTKMIDFPFQEGTEVIDKKTGKPMQMSTSESQIEVERIIYGKNPGKIITLSQLGPAGSDNGETKVRNGDRMLFLLRQGRQNKNLYYSAAAEDTMFIIDEDDRLTSLSDNITVAKYDGLKLSTLEADLKAAFKNVKK